MGFIERGRTESLAEHLLKNAEVLGADTDQVSRLRYAYRLAQGTNAERVEAGRVAVAVRSELQASVEAAAATARLRQEKLARFNDAGAMRVVGRDGLVALHKSGALTNPQAKAGLAYRPCWEAAPRGLGSSLGHAGEGMAARDWSELRIAVTDEGELALACSAQELHRAYLMVRLNQLEREVGLAMTDGRELMALQLIAGAGQTVREVAGASGHARQATTQALGRALDVVARVLRITGQ